MDDREEAEKHGMEYRAYQPESFDDGEERAPAPERPQGEGEFRPQLLLDPDKAATFEDGPRIDADAGPDFASIKFQRENTLLTNAESYAASIREEAQLYVKQLRSEVEALNHEAELRYEEAERIKAEAQEAAERLLAETQAQVEEVREQARLEGIEAGEAQGIQRRYEEAGPHLEHLEAILKEIGQFRRRVAFYTEKDGVRLALLIAKKLLQAELKVNKQVVGRILASALAKLQGKGTFRVWLSPEDHKFIVAARPSLERFLDEEQDLTLRAKADLAPGNMLIETDREVVDLTFESQFYHLEQQFKQTLNERETMLLKRRAAATPTPGADGRPPRPPRAPKPPEGTPDGR